MFLGAMADLGVDFGPLPALMSAAGIEGFRLESEVAEQHGIHGTRVTVHVVGAQAHTHRSWTDIRGHLQRLPVSIGNRALTIFGGLARVEAKIHGVTEERVEFHEVGALDSIVDIVGAAFALEALRVSEVFTRPPPLGSGTTRGQHGTIPLPAPATVALLLGKPTLLEGVGELTTPTGAAILAACATFELPARLTAQRIGYGVGHSVFADRPNVLRASLVDLQAGQAKSTAGVVVLESHIDDATPQILAHLIERLVAAGALDAALSPLTMKKGRPGQRLTVVCQQRDRTSLTELIFRESTTIGIRSYAVERDELERRFAEVTTPWGRVRVKVALLGGQVVNRTPEYEDCLALALSAGVPLKDVIAAAQAAPPG